jgi:hypothetical protein
LVIAIGCGRDDGLVVAPVHGRVTVAGEPAARGYIVFEPDPGTVKAGSTAMGGIQKDGSFTMATRDPGDGASVGVNHVGILVLSGDPVDQAPAKTKFATEGAAAKAQASVTVRERGKDGGTLRYRDGKLYRVLSPENSENPERSGITVVVAPGSNTVNFDITKDGKVQVTK